MACFFFLSLVVSRVLVPMRVPVWCTCIVGVWVCGCVGDVPGDVGVGLCLCLCLCGLWRVG